jgi:hypothetical protein
MSRRQAEPDGSPIHSTRSQVMRMKRTPRMSEGKKESYKCGGRRGGVACKPAEQRYVGDFEHGGGVSHCRWSRRGPRAAWEIWHSGAQHQERQLECC